MAGVEKVVPVAIEVPPVKDSNQLMVPADAEAPKLTVPEPHLVPEVVPVMIGIVFTVAVTAVLDALVQPLSVASA